jgi:GTP:adenosylcobinamide-phosphate guanylyltransferase
LSLTAIDASSNDHYLVIETERWAIDINEIDDFAKLLKDFINKEVKPKTKKTK